MKILISNANNQPIYEQIFTQIRNQILSGAWRRGRLCPPSGPWPRTSG